MNVPHFLTLCKLLIPVLSKSSNFHPLLFKLYTNKWLDLSKHWLGKFLYMKLRIHQDFFYA